MKMDVFELIDQHLEGGVLHLPSVFDYEDDFADFAGIVVAARKKGVTLIFDNENEVFEPTSGEPLSKDSVRFAAWAAYFVMNKRHMKHYVDYL